MFPPSRFRDDFHSVERNIRQHLLEVRPGCPQHAEGRLLIRHRSRYTVPCGLALQVHHVVDRIKYADQFLTGCPTRPTISAPRVKVQRDYGELDGPASIARRH